MPNHIQNRIRFIGEAGEIKKVIDHIAGADEKGNRVELDFNKIKPMPEELKIDSSSIGDCALSLLFGVQDKYFNLPVQEQQKRMREMSDELRAREIEGAVRYYKNIEKHGFKTWYDWSIEHWGTKWNAYGLGDKRSTEDTIYFQTAWASPVELMQELSKQFPAVKIQLDYADEDRGSNTGRITIEAGECTAVIQPKSQSKEGYDIYFDLHPDSLADYKLVGDMYEYVGEE